MENKIIYQLTRLQEHYNRCHSLQNKLSSGVKRAEEQSLRIQLKTSKTRINTLLNDIRDSLNRPVIEARYLLNDQLYYARLTNTTRAEFELLLNTLSSTKGYKIEILEIKEIPTFLCKSKL